jgi:hypothetical protein
VAECVLATAVVVLFLPRAVLLAGGAPGGGRDMGRCDGDRRQSVRNLTLARTRSHVAGTRIVNYR